MPSHYHKYEIHEHRAPTDESVRLMKEMERKVEQNILSSFKLNETEFECIIQKSRSSITYLEEYMCVFKINGKNVSVKTPIEPHERREDSIKKLITSVSEKIAVEILEPAFTKGQIL